MGTVCKVITHQPGELERLTKERDEARREYDRIANAAADLLGRLHAMVDSGELKAFPEIEALDIALVPADEHGT
jgi:hypothetical protein